MSKNPVGVIGAGSFGTTVANLLAKNTKVMLYARNLEGVDQMRVSRLSSGYKLHKNITPTDSLEELASTCTTLFPVVSSSGFKNMIQNVAPFLHPYHTLIHGTKGLDVSSAPKSPDGKPMLISKEHIRTMSDVIMAESDVVRVGCLAGPNLAKEIADNQPAATVVASSFNTVIEEGQRLLRNDRFQVYGNKDLRGIELTGVLKNIIAIAAGALSGLGYGENARGMLISRGLVEMIHIGRALGGNTQGFIGLAGVGDLVATCTSNLSRNFTVGHQLAQGKRLKEIASSMEEVAEGVNTVNIIKKFVDHEGLRAPITEMLYKVLFEDITVEDALEYLMKIPLNTDINFM